MELRPAGIPREPRRFVRLSDFGPDSTVYVHNNSLHNLLVGLNERVFGVKGPDGTLITPPRPQAKAFESLHPFRAGVLRKLGHCIPYSTEEFLGTYSGSKLKRMEEAVESAARLPLNERDAYLKTFVKLESVFAELAAPRVIQPRDARYNAVVGPYIKALEHKVYRAIADLLGHPCVTKGYNAQRTAALLRGMWDRRRRPVAVGIDMSRFDQHVSLEALLFEHSFYTGAYPQDRFLRRLLRWQRENVGYARTQEGTIKYSVRGCRMSGDMNTALGNCILMCAMVRHWLLRCGIKAEFVDNGDDVVVILEEEDLPTFMGGMVEYFLSFGFTAKVEEPVRVFERINYCATNPVFDGEEWVMVREPLRGLRKDIMCKYPSFGPNLVELTLRWATAVGKCGLSVAGGIPIYNSLYSRFAGFTTHAKRVQGFGDLSTGFEYMAQGATRVAAEPTAAARYSFWLAFGILPDVQVAIEEQMENATRPTGVRDLMTPADHCGINLSLFES